MKQSKLESSIESTANIASGFVISYFVWISIIEASGGIAHVPEPLIVTCIFTVTSWLRSYIWRRFFNAGLHRLVHEGVNKWLYTRKHS